MKHINKWVAILLMVVLVLGLSGCGGKQASNEANSTAAEKTTIRFSFGLPDNHYITSQLKDWANLAMENNENLEIKMFGSAQLYKDADAIEAVQTGAIESALAYNFNLSTIIKSMGIFDCPFLIETTDQVDKVLKSSIREKMDAELAAKNIKVLAYIPWSVEDLGICSVKPVKVPADVKGVNSRVNAPEMAMLWKHYGMNPVFMSGSELYMGLQRGVIESAHSSVVTSVERKLYEVAKNFTTLPVGVVITSIMINNDYFNKLPADKQQALVDAGKEVEAKSIEAAKKNASEILKRAEELNITVYKPTADEMKLWQADMDKVIQEIYKEKPQVMSYIEEIKKMK